MRWISSVSLNHWISMNRKIAIGIYYILIEGDSTANQKINSSEFGKFAHEWTRQSITVSTFIDPNTLGNELNFNGNSSLAAAINTKSASVGAQRNYITERYRWIITSSEIKVMASIGFQSHCIFGQVEYSLRILISFEAWLAGEWTNKNGFYDDNPISI